MQIERIHLVMQIKRVHPAMQIEKIHPMTQIEKIHPKMQTEPICTLSSSFVCDTFQVELDVFLDACQVMPVCKFKHNCLDLGLFLLFLCSFSWR